MYYSWAFCDKFYVHVYECEWWMCEWQFLFIVYADKYGDGVYDLCMFVSVCLCVCPRMWQYMSFYYTHPLAFIRW